MVFNKTMKKSTKIKILIGMNRAGQVATSTILQVGQNVSNATHPENPTAGPRFLPSLLLLICWTYNTLFEFHFIFTEQIQYGVYLFDLRNKYIFFLRS